MTESIRILLCAGAILFLWMGGKGAARENRFSEEVEQLLQQKIQLIRSLAEDPRIIKFVKESNEKNKSLTPREVDQLDKKWRNVNGIDEFIGSFISNECARALIAFQEAHEGFAEIFIADAVGLIVGETNKTSDYYQADEGWWIKAYHDGRGKSYYGEIEYDDSARAEAIALYVPVIDPQTRQAIGVIKSIYNISSIIVEL
jgi:hypothetical protein